MRIFKTFSILICLIILNTNVYGNEIKNDCSEEKNIIKKLECKVSSAAKSLTSKIDSNTEGITSKKTFADFFKKKK